MLDDRRAACKTGVPKISVPSPASLCPQPNHPPSVSRG